MEHISARFLVDYFASDSPAISQLCDVTASQITKITPRDHAHLIKTCPLKPPLMLSLTCYFLVGMTSSILIIASMTQDESQLVPERCGTLLMKSHIHPLMNLMLRSLTGSCPPFLHLPRLLPPSLIYLLPSMIQKMNMWRRNDIQVPPEVDCAPLISILVFRILVLLYHL